MPTWVDVRPDATTWRSMVTGRGWDGEPRAVKIASATAVWHNSGLPSLPIRWAVVRDPEEEFDPQALLCTDLMVDPVQILEWFILRWRLEVTGPEARAH